MPSDRGGTFLRLRKGRNMLKFTKMHGLGNDYLYHYGELPDASAWSVKLSERHFGIGSDGIVTISHSDHADFRMHIYNADGSEAKMCGNGIRCVGKYVYDRGYTDKETITIETESGIKTLQLHVRGGRVDQATVDMGYSVVGTDMMLHVLDQQIVCTPVSVGNPHVVIFTDDAEHAPLTTIGAAIEKHEQFPGGVNVEFVTKLADDHLRMRVWERGSGITMACGTGACASTAAAVKKGYCHAGKPVRVDLDGGTLYITVGRDEQVTMVGPAETICDCEVSED